MSRLPSLFSPDRRRSFAWIAMSALVLASVFPALPGDIAREAVPTAEAATFTFSSRSRPLLDCGGVPQCGVGHWNGDDAQGPAIVLQGIQGGQILTGSVGGDINWGGGAGLQNPSSCAQGNGQNAIPKQVAMGQFFDINARVVPYRKPDGSFGPSGAFILNDISQAGGVRVPQGAVGVALSYPDSDYGDNNGSCTVNVTASTVTTPPPPPVAPPAVGSGICSPGRPNLLSNGDFESPSIVNAYNGNTWAVYGGGDGNPHYPPQPSIPGWIAQYPYQVELQRNTLFSSPAASGVQYAEVDAQGSVFLRQSVQTVLGATYEIRFAYSSRPGVGAQQMGVFVNGTRIALVATGGTPAGSGLSWTCYAYRFTGNGGAMVIGFGSVIGNGAGNLMDNVSVVQVAGAPASSTAAGTVDLASDLTGLPAVVGANLTYAVYSNNTKSGTSTSWGARRVFSSPNAGTRITVQNDVGPNGEHYCSNQGTSVVTCVYPFEVRPTNFGAVTELAVTTPSACTGTFQISVATESLVIQDSNPGNNNDTMTASCGASSQPASVGGGAQCSNGRDDDNDGRIDYPADPGCVSPSDNDEFNPGGGSSAIASAPTSTGGGAQCSNGRDDDNDGRIDYPADPGCVSPSDNDEFNPGGGSSAVASSPRSSTGGGAQCSNGRDDDNDGRIDYPADPGCVSPNDNDEFNPTGGSSAPASVPASSSRASSTGGNTQCSNGIDDDNDGRIDYPADPGCVSPGDNDEFNPTSSVPASSAPASSLRSSVLPVACSDGVDNDFDGLIDYPADPGCVSPGDTDEFNPVASSSRASSVPASSLPASSVPASSAPAAACNDGLDNDFDGLVDYLQDPGCTGPTDNDEFNPVASSAPASSAPASSQPASSLPASSQPASSAGFIALTISKSAPATVIAGSTVTYQFTARNLGNGQASSVQAIDFFIDGNNNRVSPPFVFQTFSGDALSCTWNSQYLEVQCQLGNMAPGSIKNFSVQFGIPLGTPCGSTVRNQVDIYDAFFSSVNWAHAQTTVNCPSSSAASSVASSAPASSAASSPALAVTDLSITKNGQILISAGVNIFYTIDVSNAGPNAALAYTVTDPLPIGMSFVAAGSSPECYQSGLQVLCNGTNLAPGAQKTFNLYMSIPASFQCTRPSISNTAAVTYAGTDTNGANNISNTVMTTILCPGSSSSSSSAPASSAASSFHIAQCRDGIDNDGDGRIDWPADLGCSNPDDDTENTDGSASSSASSVASSAISSAVSSQVSNLGCIEVRKEAFTPSGNQLYPVPQFTFTLDGNRSGTSDVNGIVRFDNVTPGSHVVAEQLPAGWTQLSVTPVNGIGYVTPGNSCSIVTFRNQQTAQQQPAFTIVKTDGRTTASVGETLSYSVTVTNISNVAAQNVIVTDALPASLAFVSASDNASVAGQAVTWTIASLPAGQSRSLTLSAQIRSGVTAGTQIRNIASVNGTSTTGQDETTVSGGGNRVEIDIDTSEDEVDAGDELEYEIEVCNVSDEVLTGLQVIQILDDDVEVTDDDGGDEDDGSIEWTITLGANACRTFETAIELDDDFDDDEVRTTVLADGVSEEEVTDVDSGNDDDEDDDDDLDENGLTVRKEASANEVFPGGIIEYTVTVKNDSGEDLEDIVIEDRISGGGFTIVDDGGADDASSNTLRWEIDSLKDGKTKVFRYRVSVDQSAYPGQVIRNSVTVETDDEDDDYEDEAAANVTVINNLPQTGFFSGTHGKSAYLKPYSPARSSLSWTAVLSVIIAGLGTGAGAGLGRRLFLA